MSVSVHSRLTINSSKNSIRAINKIRRHGRILPRSAQDFIQKIIKLRRCLNQPRISTVDPSHIKTIDRIVLLRLSEPPYRLVSDFEH